MSANTLPTKKHPSWLIGMDHHITFLAFHHLSNSTAKNPTRFQNILTRCFKLISFTNDGWIPCILFFTCFYEMYQIYSLQPEKKLGSKNPWILFGMSPLHYMVLFYCCFFMDVLLVGSLKLMWKR